MNAARIWRWGFLGASRIGRSALAPAIASIPGHRLASVAARDPARAADYAAACGFERSHADYQSLLDDPTIDAVYIALANDAHLSWTVRALAAGKPVLCEKPLALDAAEVARMRDAECGPARVMEAFCHIHHPQMAHAIALIAAGEIGRATAMQAHFGATLANPADFRWHAHHGGGALLDLGTYCASTFRVLLGREPLSVTALGRTHGDVDMDMAAQLDFGTGVTAHFTCSFENARAQWLHVMGTRENLRFEWPFSTKGRAARLWLGEACTTFPIVDPYVLMVRDFTDAIETGRDMLHGIDASFRHATLLDAIMAASRSGGAVDIM